MSEPSVSRVNRFAGQSDIDRVLDATDLARLIGEHVSLRKKGREHVGLCPFHDDHSPSMSVVTHKGMHFYKCFACGASGNALSFVIDYHKMAFPEALRYLADRAGIELTPRDAAQRPDDRDGPAATRGEIIEANQVALEYFRAVLRHPQAGAAAREALERRGVTAEAADTFMLGAAPKDRSALATFARKRGHDMAAFIAAGLVREGAGTGDLRDAFVNRLIFPICDQLGRPIAFGGRIIDPEDHPKYWNSPESPAFSKSATLYGLHLARKAIGDSETAIVAEGYTDVIALHQAGLHNAVAALGTAFTRQHARVLQRLCNRIILLFDGDEAGVKAADRAIDVFLEDAVAAFFAETVDVRICVLPAGADPDDLLRQPGGAEELRALLEAAEDALPFLVRRVRNDIAQIDSVSGRQKRMEQLLARLADLGFHEMPGMRKRMIIPSLAQALGVSIGDIESQVPRRSRQRAAERSEPAEPVADEAGVVETPITGMVARRRRVAEENLLAVLLFEPAVRNLPIDAGEGHLLPVGEALLPEALGDDSCRAVYQAMHVYLESNISYSVAAIQEAVGNERLRRFVSDLYFRGEELCGGDEARAVDQLRLEVAALDAVRDREAMQRRIAELRGSAAAITTGPSDAPRVAGPALLSVIEERRALGEDRAAMPRGVRG